MSYNPDLNSVNKAVEILRDSNVDFALLHTTNLYPTKPEWVRLGAMQEMMQAFPDIPIGLSDHTLNNNSSIAAMALGAKIIERHFTDTRNRKGPDIICSMDKMDLANLINASKEIPLMLGGTKAPIQEEQVTIDFAFATVVSIQDIKPGEKLTKQNIWVKRPGTGKILAKDFESLLGKTATCYIKSDTHLDYGMFE